MRWQGKHITPYERLKLQWTMHWQQQGLITKTDLYTRFYQQPLTPSFKKADGRAIAMAFPWRSMVIPEQQGRRVVIT